jgi:alkylated DNA repair dioxygenase AlkB/2-polyprenyl-3-methyl-5-hydroxy-6-metoxy-1,4-benzoquinol methylase
MAVTWQPSLLDLDEPTSIDPSLTGRQRNALDETSWLDLLPSWVRGGDALLEELTTGAPWLPQRTRQMWDSEVAEPRIVAQWPDLRTLPPIVEQMRAAVSVAYATDFDLVAVNLYRDGRDSVAWHGDTVRHTHVSPIVVTVSLGARRPFRVRPNGGGATVFDQSLGAGDLLVMGGRMQHDWQHAVPKTTRTVGARMSLTFRHSGPAGAADRSCPRPPARRHHAARSSGAKVSASAAVEQGTTEVTAGDDVERTASPWAAAYEAGRDRWSHAEAARGTSTAVLGSVAPRSRILDVGTGRGVDVVRYAAAGHTVTGIDLVALPEWPAIESAWPNASFVRCALLDHVVDVPYDVVVDAGCFHHQRPDVLGRYLSAIRALLRPAGTLWLATLQPRTLDNPHAPELAARQADGVFTLAFDERSIRRLCLDAGLEVTGTRVVRRDRPNELDDLLIRATAS